MAGELHAIRSAISTSTREIGDLHRAPTGQDGFHRAASELHAVSAATEHATTAILAAVEDIELAANTLKSGGEAARDGAADVILDRVLALYEACNFQDVAGQRIRKVIATLKSVDGRLERVIAACGPSPAPNSAIEPRGPERIEARLISGPSLPGDAGHVSQSDVDAYFI